LTGAGFGGCTVNLVAKDRVEMFMDQLSRQYKKITNLKTMMIPCQPSDAVKEITEE
jgi:galactokinase